MAYDFDAKEKQKLLEEGQKAYDNSEAMLVKYGKMIVKTVIISSVVFLLSYIALMIVSGLFSSRNSGAGVGNYTFMFVQFVILLIFLYDPKQDEKKKERYETDMKILLEVQLKRLNLMKIKMITFVVIDAVFLLINIACWLYVYSNIVYEL